MSNKKTIFVLKLIYRIYLNYIIMKRNNIPSFLDFLNERINEATSGDLFEKGKKERERREKEREETFNIGVEVIEAGEEELDGKNPKTNTWYKNLYIGGTENGYFKLPDEFTVKGKPLFVGKPQYKSNASGTLYSHFLCIEDTTLNYIGSGAIKFVDSFENLEYLENTPTEKLSPKDKVAKALVNTDYYEPESNSLIVENPNLTKGKIYVGKYLSGDSTYGGIFNLCVELVDDAGVTVIVPSANFIIPRDGKFKKEEQEQALGRGGVKFRPLEAHLAQKVTDRNFQALEMENRAKWKKMLRDSNLVNYSEVDNVVKNVSILDKYAAYDVPDEVATAYNGDKVNVSGEWIYNIRYNQNPTNTRCLAIFPKSSENDNMGGYAYVDLIFVNKAFGGMKEPGDDSMVVYTKREREEIYKENKGKSYYNVELDTTRRPGFDKKKAKGLSPDKRGYIKINKLTDVPYRGPRLNTKFVDLIGYNTNTFEFRYKEGKNKGKIFELTPERYEEYLTELRTFFSDHVKTSIAGRKTTEEFEERQVIFPEIPKGIQKDVRYKFLMENFGSHSDYSKNKGVYEMKSRSNFWFLARFYNDFVLPSPVIQLMNSESQTQVTVKAFNKPFDIPEGINWGEVINNYNVSMNKTNVFAEIFYNNGKYITPANFPFSDKEDEKVDWAWKRAREFKDSGTTLSTGETDTKGKDVLDNSDYSKEVDKYLNNRDQYVESLVRTRSLYNFDATKPVGLFDLPFKKGLFKPSKPKELYYKVLFGEMTIEEFENYGKDSEK